MSDLIYTLIITVITNSGVLVTMEYPKFSSYTDCEEVQLEAAKALRESEQKFEIFAYDTECIKSEDLNDA